MALCDNQQLGGRGIAAAAHELISAGTVNAAKIPFSGPRAAQNECLKFNRSFEKG
jgi:hypothetical protein